MDAKYAKEILEKTRKDYNKIAAHFSVTRVYPRQIMKYFVEKYARSGMKILDIGCGNGILFSLLKDLGVNYLGIDISSELVVEAKKKFPKADFQVGDATKINFPQNNFDLIFAFAFLHHLPSRESREEFIKKIYSILKPGEYFICTAWNLFEKSWQKGGKNYPRMKKINASKNDTLITWKNSQGKVLAERYYYAFTLEELKNLFIKTGFKIKEMFYEINGQKTQDVLEGKNICLVAKK